MSIDPLDLSLLRSFVVVVEEGHVGRAARRLHVSQPPLSRQLQRLEADLGVPLFVRAHRRLEPTPAGRVLHDEARALLAQVERVRRAATRAANGEVGRLGIGAVEAALGSGVLPSALTEFRRARPEVDCWLLEATSDRQIDALRARSIDVAFLYTRPADETNLSFRVVARGRNVAVMHRGHPLAKRKVIPLSLLAREPLLLWERAGNPPRYDAIVKAIRTAGPARVHQEAVLMHSLCALAVAGLGVAIVPEVYRPERISEVVVRPIASLPTRIDLEMAWRSDDTAPALEAFRATVSRHARE